LLLGSGFGHFNHHFDREERLVSFLLLGSGFGHTPLKIAGQLIAEVLTR
jgi:hypothetical protein